MDWNGNGKYDGFDKMTDFYIYKKVSEYEPPEKHVTPNKPVYKTKKDEIRENIMAVVFGILIVIGFVKLVIFLFTI